MSEPVKQLALVEDDDVIRESYSEILQEAGFSVAAFDTYDAAITRFREILPDLAILDISLHGENDAGFELCKQLRLLSPTLPIIFLTSHDSDIDRISGLRLGADDYLVKSVSLEYLIVRIETLLRRAEQWQRSVQEDVTPAPRLLRGPLELDTERLKTYWVKQVVELNLTQYWTVQALVENSGQLKTFKELMKAANIVVEPNTIVAQIKHIRDRFRLIDDTFDCIKNERGRGYRWLDK